MKWDVIKSPVNCFTNFLLLVTSERNCSELQNRSGALPKASEAYLVDLLQRHQLVCYPCQVCNNEAKWHPASMWHMWKTCLKIHLWWEAFYCLNDQIFSLLEKILLLVVMNVRLFPPWGQKVPKYMTVSGKLQDKNQVLQVFSFSFVCGFLT